MRNIEDVLTRSKIAVAQSQALRERTLKRRQQDDVLRDLVAANAAKEPDLFGWSVRNKDAAVH